MLGEIAVTTRHHVITRLILLTFDVGTSIVGVALDAPTFRLQPDTPRLRVVVVYGHHCSEAVVVILASQLRHHELIDTEQTANGDVVNLQSVLILFDSSSVDDLLLEDSPSLTSEESRIEKQR